MFGLFKSKQKIIERFAEETATLINICFYSIRSDNNGDLPERFQSDKYILGYISGVVMSVAHLNGFNKSVDMGKIQIYTLELFFPDKGIEISNKVTELLNKKDEFVINGMKNGVDDYSVVHKIMNSGNDAIGSINSVLICLKNYLKENY